MNYNHQPGFSGANCLWNRRKRFVKPIFSLNFSELSLRNNGSKKLKKISWNHSWMKTKYYFIIMIWSHCAAYLGCNSLHPIHLIIWIIKMFSTASTMRRKYFWIRISPLIHLYTTISKHICFPISIHWIMGTPQISWEAQVYHQNSESNFKNDSAPLWDACWKARW